MFVLARRHVTVTTLLLGFVLTISGLCWLVLLSRLPGIGMPPRSASFAMHLTSVLAATLGRTTATGVCVVMLVAGLMVISFGLLRALSTAIERWV